MGGNEQGRKQRERGGARNLTNCLHASVLANALKVPDGSIHVLVIRVHASPKSCTCRHAFECYGTNIYFTSETGKYF